MQRHIEHEHTHEAIRDRLAAGPRPSYLRDWVYGGVDGAVTTFAIVSGVVGAHLAPHVIVILGSASLIADGFAMAAGNYLATQAEHEESLYAESVERRHIEIIPDGERDEVREVLRRLGIDGDLLDRVVRAVTADRDRWVRLMLGYEYGLPTVARTSWRAAGSTLSAFLLCGAVPLLPFVTGLKNAFWVASAATSLTFLGIGAVKSRWSIRPWWRSGIETLLVGGCTAVVAYAIGSWLRSFAN